MSGPRNFPPTAWTRTTIEVCIRGLCIAGAIAHAGDIGWPPFTNTVWMRRSGESVRLERPVSRIEPAEVRACIDGGGLPLRAVPECVIERFVRGPDAEDAIRFRPRGDLDEV